MTAGMHGAHLLAVVSSLHFRSKGNGGSFNQGQTIHVRSQADDGTWLISFQYADNASFADTFFYFQSQGAEMISDDLCGSYLIIPQLGMFMEIPSPCDGLRFNLIRCCADLCRIVFFLSEKGKEGHEHAG